VLQFFQKARPGQKSGPEQLQTKRRSFLHGDAVLGKKRQIELEAKDTHRITLFDPSKGKAPSALVLGKAFIRKMHRSPLVCAPAFEPALSRKQSRPASKDGIQSHLLKPSEQRDLSEERSPFGIIEGPSKGALSLTIIG
jgi:hypothetical protein